VISFETVLKGFTMKTVQPGNKWKITFLLWSDCS